MLYEGIEHRQMMFLNLQDVEELIGLPPEKVLLKWMNFHLKKSGYKKQVTNFSSDLKVSKKVTSSIWAKCSQLNLVGCILFSLVWC